MKKKQHKRSVFWLFTFALTAAFFWSGCVIISNLGTPTRHERKIAAEYDLAGHTDQKMLVFVNQPAWLNAQDNLRYYLMKKINENFIKKAEIPPEHLVGYNELSEFRSNHADFALLSPIEVGAALNADMVLLVMVNGYELNKMAQTNYYTGFLSVRIVLHDVATGEKLWPESARSKSIKVGFEVESRGREVALARLVSALAHCTVRYFYNCPQAKFKIADDLTEIDWER